MMSWESILTFEWSCQRGGDFTQLNRRGDESIFRQKVCGWDLQAQTRGSNAPWYCQLETHQQHILALRHHGEDCLARCTSRYIWKSHRVRGMCVKNAEKEGSNSVTPMLKEVAFLLILLSSQFHMPWHNNTMRFEETLESKKYRRDESKSTFERPHVLIVPLVTLQRLNSSVIYHHGVAPDYGVVMVTFCASMLSARFSFKKKT